MSDLDDLLTPEDKADLAAWDADAYRISIEVPTSKITDDQLDDLFSRIAELVGEWADGITDRDWDPSVYGIGPMHRKGPA